MMLKDLDNAVDLGDELGVVTPFAHLCRELWASAAKMLGPDVDHTAMALMSEAMASGKIQCEDSDSDKINQISKK